MLLRSMSYPGFTEFIEVHYALGQLLEHVCLDDTISYYKHDAEKICIVVIKNKQPFEVIYLSGIQIPIAQIFETEIVDVFTGYHDGKYIYDFKNKLVATQVDVDFESKLFSTVPRPEVDSAGNKREKTLIKVKTKDGKYGHHLFNTNVGFSAIKAFLDIANYSFIKTNKPLSTAGISAIIRTICKNNNLVEPQDVNVKVDTMIKRLISPNGVLRDYLKYDRLIDFILKFDNPDEKVDNFPHLLARIRAGKSIPQNSEVKFNYNIDEIKGAKIENGKLIIDTILDKTLISVMFGIDEDSFECVEN